MNDDDAIISELLEALRPFAQFFKSDRHDLSPAKDHMIATTFLDQETNEPLAELWIKDFRRAYEIYNKWKG